MRFFAETAQHSLWYDDLLQNEEFVSYASADLPLRRTESAGAFCRNGSQQRASEVAVPSDTEFVIAPPKRWQSVNWKELWRYRDLFLALAWRDIAVRYKQTALGILWALFQPLVTMIVFTFIFNGMAKIDSGDGTPYPIFLYVGLLLWQYYSNTLTNASGSMVANAGMIQKIYFPRLIIPATAASTGLVDLAISSVILAAMMVHYGFKPHLVGVLIVPVLLFCLVMMALGVGMFLAALNVKYRDVRYAVPFFIQIMMYVTPVIYPVKMLDSHPTVRGLMLWLNPISGVITNARAGILGQGLVDWKMLGISSLMSTVFFFVGLYYFRNTERYFADIV
jgi:lipopolysaccharide transport system permease protein